MAEGGVMQTQGTLRMALAGAAVLASLSLVIYRQGRALETLRALDAERNEHVMLESSRASLLREIEQLESRSRVVSVAGDRLGLHIPTSSEIVILQLPAPQPVVHPDARVALAVK